MTRTLAILIGAATIMSSTAVDADSRKSRKYKTDRDPRGFYTRPSTVDHRGNCQRDNGRPLDKLNLNHRCDREEFWERMRDLGGTWR